MEQHTKDVQDRVCAKRAGEDENTIAKGTSLAVAAYFIWGLTPIYWKLLDSVSSLEILFHRMLWAALFMVGYVLYKKIRLAPYLKNPKVMLVMLCTGIVVSLNWGTYIYTINSGHILEGSLGYFINPIMTILAGVLFFHERLTRVQLAATIFAFVGVGISIIGYGHVPYYGLTLAFTFVLYTSIKKRFGFPATEAFTIETFVTSAIAIVALIVMHHMGLTMFFTGPTLSDKILISVMLILCGPLTAIPLLMLNKATVMAPFSYIGFTQYIAPSMAFVLGYFVYHETLDTPRLICFIFIWIGIALILAEGYVNLKLSRKNKR